MDGPVLFSIFTTTFIFGLTPGWVGLFSLFLKNRRTEEEKKSQPGGHGARTDFLLYNDISQTEFAVVWLRRHTLTPKSGEPACPSVCLSLDALWHRGETTAGRARLHRHEVKAKGWRGVERTLPSS